MGGAALVAQLNSGMLLVGATTGVTTFSAQQDRASATFDLRAAGRPVALVGQRSSKFLDADGVLNDNPRHIFDNASALVPLDTATKRIKVAFAVDASGVSDPGLIVWKTVCCEPRFLVAHVALRLATLPHSRGLPSSSSGNWRFDWRQNWPARAGRVASASSTTSKTRGTAAC